MEPEPPLLSDTTFVCDGLPITTRSAVQGGGRLCEALGDAEFQSGLKWGVMPFDAAAMQVVSSVHWDIVRLVSIAVQEIQFGGVHELWAAHDALAAAVEMLKELDTPDCVLVKARMAAAGSAVADEDFVRGLLAITRYALLDPLAARMDGQISQNQHAVDCGESGGDSHLLHGAACAYRTGQVTHLAEAMKHLTRAPGALPLVQQVANTAVRILGDIYNHTCMFYGTVNKSMCDQVQRNYSMLCDGIEAWAAPEFCAQLKSQKEFSEFTLGSIPDKRLPVTVVAPFTDVSVLRPED